MVDEKHETLKVWFRAIAHTCLIISVLLVLYQSFMYLRFGSWNSIGMLDLLLALERDPVYWLKRIEHLSLLHSSLLFLLRAPLWIICLVVALTIRVFAGWERKNEAV